MIDRAALAREMGEQLKRLMYDLENGNPWSLANFMSDIAMRHIKAARAEALEEAHERYSPVIQCAKTLLRALDDLIDESEGVAGLHRNGDLAPWHELLRGGQFEEWLGEVESLRVAIKNMAYIGKPRTLAQSAAPDADGGGE